MHSPCQKARDATKTLNKSPQIILLAAPAQDWFWRPHTVGRHKRTVLNGALLILLWEKPANLPEHGLRRTVEPLQLNS